MTNRQLSKATNSVRRSLIWLMRARHSRGFGVQSPWAYSFIRYVVNEHYPYYAYADLRAQLPNLAALERKRCELYFRLANYRQPHVVLDDAQGHDAFKAYCTGGCAKAQAVQLERHQLPPRCPAIEMLRMSARDATPQLTDAVLENTDSQSVVIVEDIKAGPKAKERWSQLKADPRTGVTFDLYYCGIIFFDKARYKDNYIVNF